MNNQWYFDAGRSAVEVVVAACIASNVHQIDRVLDIPCGHGRVLRHLVELFPSAKFDVCDIAHEGVNFCAATFGARAIYSQEELTLVDFGALYDLIWVGSLFTHTSEDVTMRWMSHLAKFLSPSGIIVATVHGRWCEHVHAVAPYIGNERWRTILQGFQSEGYGYADYLENESHEFIDGSYGVSLVSPEKIIGIVQRIPGVRIYQYAERAWVDHQDVIVYGKPTFDQAWPSA